MNHLLLILLFLSGAVLQSCTAGSCFRVMIYKSWSNAQAYCRALSTDLCTINDDLTLNRVQNLTIPLKPIYGAWIGLYYNQGWKWSDGTVPQYFKWGGGQPSGSTSAYCADFFDGFIYDELCTEAWEFYCNYPTRKRKILQLKVQSDKDPNNPEVQDSITKQIEQRLMAHGLVTNITVRWKKQPGGNVFRKLN